MPVAQMDAPCFLDELSNEDDTPLRMFKKSASKKNERLNSIDFNDPVM